MRWSRVGDVTRRSEIQSIGEIFMRRDARRIPRLRSATVGKVSSGFVCAILDE